jgi:sugar phosphate isomerase/epimerase
MKAGLTSVTFRKLSADEIIALASEGGLDGIEWGSDVHVPEGNVALAREIAEKTRASGLEVLSYGSYFFLGAGMDFKPFLDSCVALGADVIRVWGGKKERGEMTDEEYRELVSETKKIGKMAEECGVTVGFEFHGHSITATAFDAVNLIEDVGLPGVRLYWQTVLGATREENLENLKTVSPYLVNAHAFHYTGNKQELLCDAGGKENWTDYVSALSDYGFERAVIIEFTKGGLRESFLSDAATLRGLIKG